MNKSMDRQESPRALAVWPSEDQKEHAAGERGEGRVQGAASALHGLAHPVSITCRPKWDSISTMLRVSNSFSRTFP